MATPDQDEIHAKAAAWIVRDQEGELSPAEVMEFRNWQKADSRNEQAYLDLRRLWDEIPGVPQLRGHSPLAINDDEPQPGRHHRIRKLTGWLTAVTAAAAATVYLLVPAAPVPSSASYSTDVAQISKIELADGSLVTLGPRSTIDVTFSASDRRLQLQRGEAFFEVAKDRERPFTVETGNSIVRVVGTKFDVKRGDGSTTVSVLRGVVQLSGIDRGGSKRPAGTLRKGEEAELTVDARGMTRVRRTTSDDLVRFSALTGAWRDGWLAYDDVQLREIVDDMNRYYAPGVKIADAATGDLRITASFKEANIPQFLDSLHTLFAVEAHENPDGSYSLARSR